MVCLLDIMPTRRVNVKFTTDVPMEMLVLASPGSVQSVRKLTKWFEDDIEDKVLYVLYVEDSNVWNHPFDYDHMADS